MAYDATRIRPVGRPKIEKDSNGLRKITRKYVVTGAAVAAAIDSDTSLQTIESQVFLAFGTKDDEYKDLTDQVLGAGYSSGTYTEDLGTSNTSAYLVAQTIEPAPEVSQAFLTRVYQELESTPKPVQVDQDDVKVTDAGRITVQRKFIVKNDYIDHYDPTRVGVDYLTVTHDGTARKCYLGGVQSDEHEVFTEYVETFFEDAILSITIEYRNGLKPDHKMEVRTVRAIAGAEALSNPDEVSSMIEKYGMGPGEGTWYLVSQREGPGSVNFGQSGKPVNTKVWAKGSGIVSLQQTHKHDGALEMVSIRSLREQSTVEDAGTASNGATFHRVSESMQESSGHQVFSDTYAAGKGRISVSTQTKGKIDIVKETWVSEPGGTHSSDLSNIFNVSVSKRDGFDIHSLSGTSHESGVINVSRQYKNRGTDDVFDLEIVRVTKIGAMPTSADFDASGNGASFVLVAEGKDESGQFVTYTGTFAAGVGIMQTGEKNTGKVTVKSYTSLNTEFPSDTYDHSVSDRDGYVVRTYKTYEKDSSFAGDKSKSWVNKYVYRENLTDVEESIPSPFVAGADKLAGSYSKQGPDALWSTSDATVYTDGEGVISSSVSYVSAGGYMNVKKVVASASGASAATYAPSSSVLVGQATSYERGWVRDTFTWISLSQTVEHSTSSLISWTVPGVMSISTKHFGRQNVLDKDGKVVGLGDEEVHLVVKDQPPHRIQLAVVKTTKYSLVPEFSIVQPIVGLATPWADVEFGGTGDSDDELKKEGGRKINYVYDLDTVRLGAVSHYLGDEISGFDWHLTGWRDDVYNGVAAGAILSADQSVAFTDGTTTIYKLETTVGSPTVDTSGI